MNRRYDFKRNNTQQLQIQEKQKAIEKLKQSITSLQDDLEVLSLEKVVQQDEYNTVTTEWKQKQEQVDFNFKYLLDNKAESEASCIEPRI